MALCDRGVTLAGRMSRLGFMQNVTVAADLRAGHALAAIGPICETVCLRRAWPGERRDSVLALPK